MNSVAVMRSLCCVRWSTISETRQVIRSLSDQIPSAIRSTERSDPLSDQIPSAIRSPQRSDPLSDQTPFSDFSTVYLVGVGNEVLYPSMNQVFFSFPSTQIIKSIKRRIVIEGVNHVQPLT